jgi:hypothetical protein
MGGLGTFITINSQPDGSGFTYMTANFDFGHFSGIVGGNSATMSTDFVTFGTDVPGIFQFEGPLSISIEFSNISPALSITNNSMSSFTAQNSGTFTAEQIIVPSPEPSSLGLASVAVVLGALAFGGNRLRRPGND